MAISKVDIAVLRVLQQDASWDVVLKMLDVRIKELGARAAGILGKDAFEELRVIHKCQGGVEELKQFFEDLERMSFE